MNPVYHHSHDGFVAPDLDTGIPAYAYPTSPYWVVAKRKPEIVALEMLATEIMARRWVVPEIAAAYDAANRARLHLSA